MNLGWPYLVLVALVLTNMVTYMSYTTNRNCDVEETQSVREIKTDDKEVYRLDVPIVQSMKDNFQESIMTPRQFGPTIPTGRCHHPQPRMVYYPKTGQLNQALKKHGFQLTQNAATPNITLWFPYRLSMEEKLALPLKPETDAYTNIWTRKGDSKHKLHAMLKNYAEAASEVDNIDFDLNEIYPRSFWLGDAEECEELFDWLDASSFQKGAIFFHKNVREDQGIGISVYNKTQMIEVGKTKYRYQPGNGCGKLDAKFLVQRGVKNLLLLESKKFDIRNFLFVPSYKPLVAYYHKGYLRRAVVDFNEGDTDLQSNLSNGHIQRDAETEGERVTAWSMERMHVYLLEDGYKRVNSKMRSLTNRMKRGALIFLLAMVNEGFDIPEEHTNSVFQLFGLDFLVDTSIQPWLVETNTNPGLVLENSYKDDLLKDMINDMLALLGEVRQRKREGLPVSDSDLMCTGSWELLYDETCKVPWDCSV